MCICLRVRQEHAAQNPKSSLHTDFVTGASHATESELARHWLRADGPISNEEGNKQNLLGLVALSDIFTLDSTLRIYGLGFDLKTEKSPNERLARNVKAMTTINHSIHLVNVDAVRVDEWVYIECQIPWASDGRIMVQSRMFSRAGILLATCAQEVSRAFILMHTYVLLTDFL